MQQYDNKDYTQKSLQRTKLNHLTNYNSSNHYYDLLIKHNLRTRPMIYLMNQTLHKDYESILINKRQSRHLPMLEDSMKINPVMLYTTSATITNHYKERNKRAVKWSRNKPILNGLLTKSTFMNIGNTQGGSTHNCKLTSKKLNKTNKSNEVSSIKLMREYKSTEQTIGNNRNKKAVQNKKKKNKRLFENSFLDKKIINNTEENTRENTDVNDIKNDPNSILFVMNQFFCNIECNLTKEMNSNENMIKKYKLLRNDIRVKNDHIKDILGSLIRRQRDNDEYLTKKKYLFKKKKCPLL